MHNLAILSLTVIAVTLPTSTNAQTRGGTSNDPLVIDGRYVGPMHAQGESILASEKFSIYKHLDPRIRRDRSCQSDNDPDNPKVVFRTVVSFNFDPSTPLASGFINEVLYDDILPNLANIHCSAATVITSAHYYRDTFLGENASTVFSEEEARSLSAQELQSREYDNRDQALNFASARKSADGRWAFQGLQGYGRQIYAGEPGYQSQQEQIASVAGYQAVTARLEARQQKERNAELAAERTMAVIDERIEASNRQGNDIFSELHPLMRSRLRLIHSGDFEAAELVMRRDAENVANPNPVIGLIIDTLRPDAADQIEESRYAGLFAMYAISRADNLGSCGESTVSYNASNTTVTSYRNLYGIRLSPDTYRTENWTFRVPSKFAPMVDASQTSSIDWRMANSLKTFFERAGGCNSPTIQQLEQNMIRFYQIDN